MPQTRIKCRWICVLVLAITLTYAALVGAGTPLQKVVFVFSGFNERTSFIFVAKDRHFFEEQGLDAQIVQVRNGPVAVSAMAANEAEPKAPIEHFFVRLKQSAAEHGLPDLKPGVLFVNWGHVVWPPDIKIYDLDSDWYDRHPEVYGPPTSPV